MYIVVEGCIGWGKTTVAKLLAAKRNGLPPEDWGSSCVSIIDWFGVLIVAKLREGGCAYRAGIGS